MDGRRSRSAGRAAGRPAAALGALLLAAAVVLAGCGSATAAPPPDASLSVSTSHPWVLEDDLVGDSPDVRQYRAILTGCDAGQQTLDAHWSELTGPREVLDFAAAIDMCRGDQAAATTLYRTARDTYGPDGLGPDPRTARCSVHRALAVSLDLADPAAVPCPGGASPSFRRSVCGVPDNPLTTADEATAGAATACSHRSSPPPPPSPRPRPSGSTSSTGSPGMGTNSSSSGMTGGTTGPMEDNGPDSSITSSTTTG